MQPTNQNINHSLIIDIQSVQFVLRADILGENLKEPGTGHGQRALVTGNFMLPDP